MRVTFYTLGCKVNQNETGALAQLFEENGYTVVSNEEPADVYVVNSCTVTNFGDQKSRKWLRRAKRENPGAVTVLTGCYPQAFPEEAAEIKEADVVTGSGNRHAILADVTRVLNGEDERVVDIRPHRKGEKFEELPMDKFAEHTRAFVKVEDGCNRQCAYCVIPRARGPVRSRDEESILEELRRLAAAGYKEVVLTAIIIFSLPLWKKPGEETGEEIAREHRTLPQLMRVPGVPEVMAMFACYSVVETTAGMWASSYCTLQRGIDAGTAASWASLFYVGITVGRFLSGFIAMKLNDHQMINLGFVLVALGILPILLPLGSAALVTGLVTVGLGCAPIYPSIIHETPLNFGRNLSMALTGVQMAAAYVGNVVFPPLFGLLAQYISISLYPWYLLAALVLMAVMSRALHRKTAAKRAANGY